MDNIVVGISRLNFKQNLCEINHDNSAPNLIKNLSVGMSSLENISYLQKQNGDKEGHDYTSISLGLNESVWEDLERDEDNSDQNLGNRKGYLFSQRRKMPSRASKESSLLGIKRRTIMKPSKRSQTVHGDITSLKPADIKKIYLNKKMTNFRPSSLETIFEEDPCNESVDESFSRTMSARKIRRMISFSDGHEYKKSLVKKRRNKIKKTFGKQFAFKKISLEEFIEKLNSSVESDECRYKNEQIDMVESKDVSAKAIQSADVFMSDSGNCSTNTFLTPTTPMMFSTNSSL